MTDVHLLKNLTWEVCPARASCTVTHHLPDIDINAARELNRDYIINLFQLDQAPPAEVGKFHRAWQDENGEQHRDYDLPAVIFNDGSKYWYRHGLSHRDHDLPAVIYAAGGREWWQNGEIHRDNDLPAMIDADGSRTWYIHGRLGRANSNNPTVITSVGAQVWHDDKGLIHRDSGRGPAVINADGTEEYWQHGSMKYHLDPITGETRYGTPDETPAVTPRSARH